MGSLIHINLKWEDMCGPGGLQPWNQTSGDFGLCFQKLFLQVPAFFLFAIGSGYFVGYRKDWVSRERVQEISINFRSIIVLCLAFLPIIHMYTLITSKDNIMYPIDYFSAGTACLSWLVHFSFLLSLKHRLGISPRGPVGILILWSVCTILNVVILRSLFIESLPPKFEIATLVLNMLYFISLLPSSNARPMYYSRSLVGSQHSQNEYTPLLPYLDDDVLGAAMQDASFLSKITLSWVEPLFKKGIENKLKDVDELFELSTKCRCSYIGARLDHALIGNVDQHQRYEDLPHEPFISSGYGALGETSAPVSPIRRVLVRPTRRQNVSLLRALHSCFGWSFYSIGILKFVSDASGFAGPMLLSRLVLFVEDETVDLHIGYLYAAGMFASALVGALFIAQFNWLMSLIGIKMKGAIISVILKKLLSISPAELSKSFSEGEITNFMSTDTDRIVNSCPSFHALWSIPLQLFVTLFLMYQQVGVSFLAGVAFAVVLIPINKYVANRIGDLSTHMMTHKDARVSLLADLLRGIRTIKMHVWEDYFIERITESRDTELRYLRGRKYLDAVCVVLWASTPVILTALTLLVYVLVGGDLRPNIVFTTVALVNMLISPLNAFPWVLNGLTEAWVSIKRIQKLLEVPEMDNESYYDRLDKNLNEDAFIIIKNATFSWSKPSERLVPAKRPKGKGRSMKKLSRGNIQRRNSASSGELLIPEEPFMLRNIDLEIRFGQLIGIGGPIGSGKTSLLHAIMAFMEKKEGEIQIRNSLDGFGYVSQKPWLVRGTIRENIIFGRPYDENKFRTVIDACALTEDLNVLGWNSSVGSSGCTLSGGQKSRIALARAVYQDKQVYLFDDVLSSVDNRVGQHIMQKCIVGLLEHTTRVFVTHNPRHLRRADRVLLVREGRIVSQGAPDAVLSDMEDYLPETSLPGDEAETTAPVPGTEIEELDDVSQDNEENISHESIGWRVVCMYIRSAGVGVSLAILMSLFLMQLSQNFTFLWLSFWVNNRLDNTTSRLHVMEESTFLDHSYNVIDNSIHSIINTSKSIMQSLKSENITQPNDTTMSPFSTTTYNTVELRCSVSSTDMFYLEVYFGLAGLNLIFTIMRAFLFAYGGLRAATKIHKSLLKIVVKANVKFFDVTPTGRIVNRFSSDTYTVDDSLPFIMNILLAQIFSLFGAMSVSVYGLPWLFVALIPLVPIYLWLQRRYRVLSRHLKRLQSVALSPIYSHFTHTMDGNTTIISQRSTTIWQDSGEGLTERWQRAACSGAAASAWLALRLQTIAAVLCGCAALVAVVQRQIHLADAGLIGLAISYALSMTSTLGGVMSAFTETEREMIAVERVAEYIDHVEIEKIDGDPPPYGWPSQGVISFKDVVLKYRDDGPPALDGITLSTYPGEKLGVVGRTGAGKSTLCAAILRMSPLSHGTLTIDGVDVTKLHLHALRSRIGVIPQEPFIFSGTIHENLDPLQQYSADELWQALERCSARGVVSAKGGLTGAATELSRGHKQLLCLARALLQRPKILLIDEATASVDEETERVLSRTLRETLVPATALLVAHRLHNVLHCHRIAVMDKGKIIECDQPDVLLDDPSSILYAMFHARNSTS